MPYNQDKDQIDNGSALNLADLNECGIGTATYASYAGYMIDPVESYTATAASSGLSLANFNSLFDGTSTTSAVIPQTTTSQAEKYIYLKLTNRTRLNKLFFKTAAPLGSQTTLAAEYTAVSSGTPGTPPTTGWTPMSVGATWTAADGYTILPATGSYVDALWVRLNLVYTGVIATER